MVFSWTFVWDFFCLICHLAVGSFHFYGFFLKREEHKVEWVRGDLEGVGRGKNMIRICCMNKFNKEKNVLLQNNA